MDAVPLTSVNTSPVESSSRQGMGTRVERQVGPLYTAFFLEFVYCFRAAVTGLKAARTFHWYSFP